MIPHLAITRIRALNFSPNARQILWGLQLGNSFRIKWAYYISSVHKVSPRCTNILTVVQGQETNRPVSSLWSGFTAADDERKKATWECERLWRAVDKGQTKKGKHKENGVPHGPILIINPLSPVVLCLPPSCTPTSLSMLSDGEHHHCFKSCQSMMLAPVYRIWHRPQKVPYLHCSPLHPTSPFCSSPIFPLKISLSHKTLVGFVDRVDRQWHQKQ